jgi:uncharacterized protein (DUF4415 family)
MTAKRPLVIDDENPEWTAEEFARARPLKEGLPDVYEALRQAKRGRGPQKRPTKVMLAMRVNREALAKWRATGKGWQTRLAATIERAAQRLPKRRARA